MSLRPSFRRWLFALAFSALVGCAVEPPRERAPDGIGDDSPRVRQQDVFALSSQADLAYSEGRWGDAVGLFEALTSQVPDDAHAWLRLANTYARQGAFDRAVVAYERSVRRDGSDPRAWFNLSTAYLVNAQHAMTRAWQAMRPEDPARAPIEARLDDLGKLMQARIDDARAWIPRTRSH